MNMQTAEFFPVPQPVKVGLVPTVTGSVGRADPASLNPADNASKDVKSCKNKVPTKIVMAEDIAKVTTKLNKETEFQGDYKSTRANVGISIAGSIGGTVTLAEGSVFILEECGVAQKCRVEAETVLIEGHFSGEVVAAKIEITSSAKVEGRICYEEICIHRGSTVQAEHAMISS